MNNTNNTNNMLYHIYARYPNNSIYNNNNDQLLSGYVIRHSPNIIECKESTTKIESLQKLINQLDETQKNKFKELCDHLVIGLRDRYSGCQDTNGGKDLKLPSSGYKRTKDGNIRITVAGLEKYLKEEIKCNGLDSHANTILSLCTHRHTTITSVLSYPKTLKKLFSNLKIDINTNDLSNIKDQVDQNKIYFTNSIFFILSNGQLQGCNLENADFSNAYLKDVNFHGANLKNAKFQNAKFENVYLRADLENANFTNADLQGVNFKKQEHDAKFWEKKHVVTDKNTHTIQKNFFCPT